MMAAVMAEGKTIIENAAKEPHVVDLANFLNSMGANIKGAGTDVIRVRGVERLHGTEYAIIPDQIDGVQEDGQKKRHHHRGRRNDNRKPGKPE